MACSIAHAAGQMANGGTGERRVKYTPRSTHRPSFGYVSPMHRTNIAALALGLALASCASGPRPLQLLAGADPVYPPAARAAGIEGEVTVRYDVTAAGRVVNAVVLAASPAGVFEQAALAAVASWRFRPPTARSEPSTAPGRVSVLRFRLGDAYGQLPPPPAGK